MKNKAELRKIVDIYENEIKSGLQPFFGKYFRNILLLDLFLDEKYEAAILARKFRKLYDRIVADNQEDVMLAFNLSIEELEIVHKTFLAPLFANTSEGTLKGRKRLQMFRELSKLNIAETDGR